MTMDSVIEILKKLNPNRTVSIRVDKTYYQHSNTYAIEWIIFIHGEFSEVNLFSSDSLEGAFVKATTKDESFEQQIGAA